VPQKSSVPVVPWSGSIALMKCVTTGSGTPAPAPNVKMRVVPPAQVPRLAASTAATRPPTMSG
jgi:hypothetical protein